MLALLVSAALASTCSSTDLSVASDLQLVARAKPVPSAPGNSYGVAPLALSAAEQARYSPELRAFLRTLAYTEGVEKASGYYTEVGGKVYPSSTRIHPGATDVYRYSKTGHNSDAFGRYQMISSTWAAWAKAAGIPTAKSGKNSYGEPYYDMSPANQDIAVLEFLRREGVERYLSAGNISGAAANSAAQNWASVPGATQHNERTGSFYKVYAQLLAEEKAR